MYKQIRAIVMAVSCVVAVIGSQQVVQATATVAPAPKVLYMDAYAGTPDPQLYVSGYLDAKTPGTFTVCNDSIQFFGSVVKYQFFAADSKGAIHTTVWLSGVVYDWNGNQGPQSTARIDVTKYANGSYSFGATINPGTTLVSSAAKELPWSGGNLVMK